MSSNDECNLKAGHPPAVKAGGMRITQHKTPREEPGISEDITGLQGPHSPPKALTVSGAITKGNADFTVEAVQSFHKDKPPVAVPQKPMVHIQQPRK
ncbi:uncharacterized protein CBL_08710 [Carabus blaptoides fortunei]